MKSEIKACQTFKGYLVNADGSQIFKSLNDGHKKKIRINSFVIKNKYPARWVNIKVNGKYVNFAVSKLVSDAFIKPYKRGQIVKHVDGNTMNDHYTNLKVYSSYHFESEEVIVTSKTIKLDSDNNDESINKSAFGFMILFLILLLLGIFIILYNIH